MEKPYYDTDKVIEETLFGLARCNGSPSEILGLVRAQAIENVELQRTIRRLRKEGQDLYNTIQQLKKDAK